VRLTHVATGQTYDTVAATRLRGLVQRRLLPVYGNLPSGSIPPEPSHPAAGLICWASEPVVNYAVAGQSIQQNLALNPLGAPERRGLPG
jgi:hypothetical protein